MHKLIIKLSDDLMKDILEQMTVSQAIEHLKTIEPKNKIEKKILQRSVCILGGYLMCKNGTISNHKLEYLVNHL